MISKTAEYALRAVLYIARESAGDPIRAIEIADNLEVPSNYLSKILHSLARGGIPDHTACAVHERWKQVREPIWRFFRETTVADVVKGLQGTVSAVRTGIDVVSA